MASAANRAAQALAGMGAAQTGIDSGSGGYKVVDVKYGRTIRSGLTQSEAQDYINSNKSTSQYFTIMKAAKGGIVTKDDKNPFNKIAKSLGEDVTLVAKEGESVLTPEQTEGLVRLAPLLEDVKKDTDDNDGKAAENSNGEITLPDGTKLVLAKTDLMEKIEEAMKNPDFMPNFQNLWNVPDFSKQFNIPEVTRIEQPSVNLHYDSLVTVNGDVNDTKHFLSQMETVSKKCTNQILNDINTNFKYSRRR